MDRVAVPAGRSATIGLVLALVEGFPGFAIKHIARNASGNAVSGLLCPVIQELSQSIFNRFIVRISSEIGELVGICIGAIKFLGGTRGQKNIGLSWGEITSIPLGFEPLIGGGSGLSRQGLAMVLWDGCCVCKESLRTGRNAHGRRSHASYAQRRRACGLQHLVERRLAPS